MAGNGFCRRLIPVFLEGCVVYLTDYHTHSLCSPDSTTPLSDMVAAARRAGLRELCTTDHCDLQREDGSPLTQWDWEPILSQYHQVAAQQRPNFRLLLGLELGGAHTDPALAQTILEGAPLDFVIGSVHNLSPAAGGRDLFCLDLSDLDNCWRTMDDYFDSLLALAPLPVYDALGHIIYPLRYINGRAGHNLTLERYNDQLDKILRTVIQTGRAIEVNTHGGREVEEWRPILERYRVLGGELVTTGSDAHRPYAVGKGLRQVHSLLWDTGFRWLTLYRGRKPTQVKLR